MDNRGSNSALSLNSAMRPPTSQRPPMSQRPPTTNAPMSRAGPPGTASRLISAASGRPSTRGSIAQGIGLSAQIAVSDRPVSQQGLVAPKTGSRVQQRQVQDKSYFVGLLRSKISELSTEISRMTKESESLSHEQSTYLTYEKRAEVLASELKDLQGELADYNLLVDKLNTDAEMDEVEAEYKELKAQNEQESKSIDVIFEERQAKETVVRQLEAEIDQERYMAENLIAAMKPELKQKFSSLKESSQSLRNDLSRFQQQLDSLNSQKTSLEDELAMSQVKQEAVSLYEKLRELEEKRDTLLEEERGRGTPQQEWDKLLKQVKDDNGELASIERQTVEVRDKISRAQEELAHLEQELEDHQGERITKYRELRKREEGIDNFLVSFDETKETEEDRQHALERDIVELLERISRGLAHFQHLPSPQEFAMLKDDLMFKEGETEKSRATVTSLGHEQKKLGLDLQKIEQLESKVQQELETLKEKIKTMEDEMVIYSNLDQLKLTAEDRRQRLIEEEKHLHAKRDVVKKVLSEASSQYEELKSKLNDNETFTQLKNLERRWQHQEQNNFAMKEFIATKKAETDFRPTQKVVLGFINEYNKLLQNSLSKGSYGQ